MKVVTVRVLLVKRSAYEPKVRPQDVCIPRSRGDGLTDEARAIRRPGSKVGETGTGSGNLTVAVVAGASTLLNDRAKSQAGERENDGGLHFQRV